MVRLHGSRLRDVNWSHHNGRTCRDFRSARSKCELAGPVHRVHSLFIERMNRSTTEMLPYFFTAPKRGRIRRRVHQSLKESHQNWAPLSEITCLGAPPTLRIARSRKCWISVDVGRFKKTAKQRTAREK